jgi:Protein of unknown function (DUF2867)
MSKVTDAPIPADALLARALPRIDYSDAYSAPLPSGVTTAAQLARACFAQPSLWARGLFAVRQGFARLAGLQTATPAHGERLVPIGHVYAVRDEELLWGMDDEHLDFRSSFLVRDGVATIGTVVQLHNRLGRAYFAVVKPFHRQIVRRMLRGAATSGRPRPLPSGT